MHNCVYRESETRPALKRSGSYEIPQDQLDPSLSRPVIDPDPVFSTPYSGNRKSEVFIVEFGGNKRTSRISAHSEPRVLFRDSTKYNASKSIVRLYRKHIRLGRAYLNMLVSNRQTWDIIVVST